jgi:hypothetical protein
VFKSEPGAFAFSIKVYVFRIWAISSDCENCFVLELGSDTHTVDGAKIIWA